MEMDLWSISRVERRTLYPFRTSQVALVVKNVSANAGDARDEGSIPGLWNYERLTFYFSQCCSLLFTDLIFIMIYFLFFNLKK